MSEIWLACPKCGKKHSFPLGILRLVKKLEVTCECGEKIAREKPDVGGFRDGDFLRLPCALRGARDSGFDGALQANDRIVACPVFSRLAPNAGNRMLFR
jgi:hypothetical protein